MATRATAASAEVAAESFTPPGEPLRLTRTLVRPLFDGREIVTTRTWRIVFTADGGGWRVDGNLLDSRISAPPALAPMAELERTRPDEGLFPLRLDRGGRLLFTDQGFGGDSAAFEKAAAMAGASIARGGNEADARRFLAQVQAAAAGPITSHWPASLFAPGSDNDQSSSDLTLPDGGAGRFASYLERTGRSGGSLPGTVERRITTTIGGASSTTIERWEFTPD